MSPPRYGRAFWIALPVGAALMTFGAVGLVGDSGVGAGAEVFGWLVGADVAHDFVLAPLACVVGAAVARALPRWCRAPIQAALLTSGVLLIVVFPALRGFGRDQVPDNTSVQPLDYTTATLTALAVVWVTAAVWLVVRLATSDQGRRRPRTRATRGDHPTSPR
jgi:uncharacterized membrane protein YoaK (UPF0700 family)